MAIVYLIVRNKDDRAAIGRILSRRGFEVEIYRDIDEFLAEDGRPAGCVIVDLEPCCAAVGVMSQINAMREPMPTIVLSPSAVVRSAVRAMKEGAVNFLVRPIDMDALLASVGVAVELSRARSAQARRRQELAEKFQSSERAGA